MFIKNYQLLDITSTVIILVHIIFHRFFTLYYIVCVVSMCVCLCLFWVLYITCYITYTFYDITSSDLIALKNCLRVECVVYNFDT